MRFQPAIAALALMLASAASPAQAASLEAGEAMPGGAATHSKPINRDVFSHPSANLTFEQEMQFKVGNGFFRRLWVAAPASTKAADGLGPLFNARACQNCHLKDGRGRPPENAQEDAVALFLRLSIPPQTEEDKRKLAEHRTNVIPDPVYGGQLQNFALSGHTAEGRMTLRYTQETVKLAGGEKAVLHRPHYGIANPGYGPLRADLMTSPRLAPQMIGLGLLEAIPEAEILAQADPEDRNGDGISGKPQQVWSLEQQKVMLGRFGWKGGTPSVAQQSAEAFAGDMGLSTPLVPANSGDCTSAQEDCLAAPHGGDPQYGGFEVPQSAFDLVAFYSRNLAVPMRREAGDAQVLRGKQIFSDIGCAACHRPSYTTGQIEGRPEHSGQKIWPYTDLLLHDLGDGLADHRPEGVASGREWKTPPLWGVGLSKTVTGGIFLLHDGRAHSVLEAVLWHGGEAQSARDKVVSMSKSERAALIRFLNSL